jgi:hypothetical protein
MYGCKLALVPLEPVDAFVTLIPVVLLCVPFKEVPPTKEPVFSI